MVLLKIIGGLAFLLGLSIVIGFPFFYSGSSGFQFIERGKAGIIFGVIIMTIGFLMAYFLD